MSDKPYNWADKKSLPAWALGQMLTGAGWAALVVFGSGIFIYAVYLFSFLLPEESKQAPAPMPQPLSVIEMPYTGTAVV